MAKEGGAVLEGLTYDLDELRLQLADAERRAEALRLIIRGVETLGANGEGPATGNGNGSANGHVAQPTLLVGEETIADGPRGQAAVRVVVAEHPGRTWTLRALARELIRHGWASSPDLDKAEHSLGEAVRRMAKTGEATRVRPGVYRFTSQEEVRG